MIVCFNCSPETKAKLDSLLESGQYGDYSEVISLAIANLAILQEEVLKSGGLVIGSDSKLIRPVRETDPSYTPDPEESVEEGSLLETHPIEIPALFHLDGLTDSPPSLIDPPDDIWAPGQNVSLDRWIFGQYNRLLPAKASCRALANLLVHSSKGLPLDEVAQHIAEEAARLGDFLTLHDKQNDITRDNALSTAFPSTGTDGNRGRLRYASQFVASVNKYGQVSGLLIDLKLINSTGGRKKTRLMLTETGWRFATMPSPILEGTQKSPTEKFSADECAFLLGHIARSVPVEDFAYRTILKAILEGADTPGTVDSALRQHIPQDRERELSDSFLSSQRSGAVSRMTDLGLIERVRNGVRVSYVVTDIGNEYLENNLIPSIEGGS